MANKSGELSHGKEKAMINLDNVTLEDCMELFEKKGKTTIINDGKIIDFVNEK